MGHLSRKYGAACSRFQTDIVAGPAGLRAPGALGRVHWAKGAREKNLDEKKSSQREVAIFVAEAAAPTDLDAIRIWAGKLLEIRSAPRTKLEKAKAAVALTASSKVVWPVAKMVAKQAKKIGWDDRSRTARLGLGGAAIGAAVFGGKSAGIAALGTAIGVPLWVVLGAGASSLMCSSRRSLGARPEGRVTPSSRRNAWIATRS